MCSITCPGFFVVVVGTVHRPEFCLDAGMWSSWMESDDDRHASVATGPVLLWFLVLV